MASMVSTNKKHSKAGTGAFKSEYYMCCTDIHSNSISGFECDVLLCEL